VLRGRSEIMAKPKPPEAAQPVRKEHKPKTCLDCGFLTIEGCELTKLDRAELAAYSRTKRGEFYWTSGEMPFHPGQTRCFRDLWKGYDPEWMGFDGKGFVDQIERARDRCSGFAPYEVGYTPAEVIKQLAMRGVRRKSEAKRGPGHPKVPNVAKRRRILKEQIKEPRELNDPRKIHNLFARFDREGVKPYGKTPWLEHLRPENQSELKLTLSNLRRDLSRT
jgi:hypothetical protein